MENYEIIINHWEEGKGYTHSETIGNKPTAGDALCVAQYWHEQTKEEIEVKDDNGETVFKVKDGKLEFKD